MVRRRGEKAGGVNPKEETVCQGPKGCGRKKKGRRKTLLERRKLAVRTGETTFVPLQQHQNEGGGRGDNKEGWTKLKNCETNSSSGGQACGGGAEKHVEGPASKDKKTEKLQIPLLGDSG